MTAARDTEQRQEDHRNGRVIVFDLGGVLIEWDPRLLYRKIFSDEAEVDWFLANVCTPDWNHRLDEGRDWAEAIDELVEKHPDYESPIRDFRRRWPEMLGGAIAGTVAILGRLKDRQTPVFALTNWAAVTFPHALERFDFLSGFDGIVVSGQIGIAKPHPGIYEHLLSSYSLAPEQVTFIDDKPENVEAAQALGMDGHVFRSADRLADYLVDSGFLDRG